MKKSARSFELHRETLLRLDDATLAAPVGGIFPKQPQPVSGQTQCACTFTCAGCLSQ